MDEDEKITEKALLRIKKRPVGYRSEDFVNYFLSPWFSGYWAFPKPKYKGGEIADSLLLWGDVAFLIEVKDSEVLPEVCAFLVANADRFMVVHRNPSVLNTC